MHKRNCSASNSSTASASSFVAGGFASSDGGFCVASDGFSEKRSSGTVCIYMCFTGIIGSSFD